MIDRVIDIGQVVGVIGGIISTFKLFVFNRILSRRQRSMLIILRKSKHFSVCVVKRDSSGYEFSNLPEFDLFSEYVFSISPKQIPGKYRSDVDLPFSSMTLLLLEDLFKKGLVDKPNTDTYMMTSHADRVAWVYERLIRVPLVRQALFVQSSLYSKE